MKFTKLLTYLTFSIIVSIFMIGSANAASFNSSRSNKSDNSTAPAEIEIMVKKVGDEAIIIAEQMVMMEEASGYKGPLEYTVTINVEIKHACGAAARRLGRINCK